MATHRSQILLIALVVGLFYLPLCHFQFILFDDNVHTYENPQLKQLNSPRDLKPLWSAPYFNLYIPVTYSAWAIEAKVGRLLTRQTFSSAVFHLGNVVFHTMNAILVFSILMNLEVGPAAAVLGALLFALHPLQVESVAWVSSLKDVLSGFFALLAILLSQRLTKAPDRHGTAIGIILCLLAAPLCKPSTVIVPLLILAVVYDQTSVGARKVKWICAAGLCISLIYSFVTWRAQALDSAPVPLSARPLVAADAIFFYVQKVLFPFSLALDYGRSPAWLIAHTAPIWFWILPSLSILAVVISLASRHRLPALLFLIPLWPVLGAVGFRFQIYSTVADRYLYLSMLGPTLLAARLFASTKDSRSRFAVPAITAFAVVFLSARQIGYWKDSESLFTHVLSVNPGSKIARNNLGNYFERRGELTKAWREYRKEVELDPNWLDARYNLAHVLFEMKQFHPALQELNWILAHDPNYQAANETKRAIMQFR